MRKFISFFLLFMLVCVCSEARTQFTINTAWKFCKGDFPDASDLNYNDSGWQVVNVPHTWNDKDAADDKKGYYRGGGWYRKSVFVGKEEEGKSASIYFERANQEVKVFVNGQMVGEHNGGYTRFCFDITRQLRYGRDNLIAVYVNNRHNADIPPLSADFTFWGGIYRDVYLRFTDPVHIATGFYASSGVFVRTPQVDRQKAEVEVTTLLTNDLQKNTDVILETIIRDSNQQDIIKKSETLHLSGGKTVENATRKIMVNAPHLWDIDDPYLYTVYMRLRDKETGRLLDEVASPLGFRWFSFSHKDGFMLNGKYRKLTGTSRHQDFLDKGNALPDELHERDIYMLKAMGSNFLRVSHYPQDPVIMEMCDKLGLVASVEIPLVNAVTGSDAFLRNSLNMVKEMLYQNFNSPSILIWAYMNEILIHLPYPKGDKLTNYYQTVAHVAGELDKTIRHIDPARYTMLAMEQEPVRYEESGLVKIPMIIGLNVYKGWYGNDIHDFERYIDRADSAYKDKALIITEYGAGVDSRIHSYKPEMFDFSQEYGLDFHRHYMREILKRPFIAGSNAWNFNDFYAEQRGESMPHVNNKGLVTLDRTPKDTYYFYQALLSRKPVLVIGNRQWKTRAGISDNGLGKCTQSVPVFTNGKVVELFCNGKSLGSKGVSEGCVFFEVPFKDGENILEARSTVDGQGLTDVLKVNFDLVPAQYDKERSFKDLNVSLGDTRYIYDPEGDFTWLPEKPYVKGGWGFVGGVAYRRKAWVTADLLGTDMNIHGTEMDPLFQTQRVGIRSFKADVPDGKYAVYLYWAELNPNEKRTEMVYNLGANTRQKVVSNRRFSVAVNGENVLAHYDILREQDAARAIIKKFVVTVDGGRGLSIDFSKEDGEPVLNAIRIYRAY